MSTTRIPAGLYLNELTREGYLKAIIGRDQFVWPLRGKGARSR